MQQSSSSIDLEVRAWFKSKKVQMYLLPVRALVSFSLVALIAGGPQRLFGELPGQVFSALFLLQVILERVFMAPDLGGSHKDRGSLLVAFVGLALTYTASMVEWYYVRPYWAVWDFNWIWTVVGGAMFAAGMILRFVSMLTLGKFFTGTVRIHEGHEMIQVGPYRWIRHPAYLGLSILTLGVATIFASLFGYICFVLVYIPCLMRRIRVEEEVLIDEFGESYLEYGKRAKRLVPFIF